MPKKPESESADGVSSIRRQGTGHHNLGEQR
jgi:hypothetical protein